MSGQKTPKSAPQELVRIYAETKKELRNIIFEMEHRERRTVTEIEIVDPIVSRGLRKIKKKLGI